jgi:hypothetical protein
VPPDLDARIVSRLLSPVAALLDIVDAPPGAEGHARAIAARLDALDDPASPVERRRALVHAYANARKLAAFIAGEKVRTGEAAEALLVLRDELGRFVPLDGREWAAIAEDVRRLP